MGKRVLAAGPRKADTGIQAGMSSMRVVNRAICVCLLKNQRKREKRKKNDYTKSPGHQCKKFPFRV